MALRTAYVEIDADQEPMGLAFTANSKYLVSGGTHQVRVWRVEDPKQIASMSGGHSPTVSGDGRYIAAGSSGNVVVWNADTYDHVCTFSEFGVVEAMDFSPDATRLVAGYGWRNQSASVWDISSGQRVLGPLPHDSERVTTAKYSPQGDRIATATRNSIRVYDSAAGHLLVDIPTGLTPFCNGRLLWSKEHLFALADGKIKQFEAATGSLVTDWSVPDTSSFSCVAMPEHEAYIACSGSNTVTLWDTSTLTHLGAIPLARAIHSIAFSPGARFLAIAGEGGRITISRLSNVVSLTRPHQHTIEEPDTPKKDYDIVFERWTHDQREDAEVLLTESVSEARNSLYYTLALRSLLRSHLRQLDAAISDANRSIESRPSVIGYIAKSVALVVVGRKLEGYRTCDIAFAHSHLAHINFLILIKAIIVFMAGEHEDAISRLDDLIAAVPFKICFVVQAYMYLLLGTSCGESGDYTDAIQWFERARVQVRQIHESQPLVVISLISGWKFDDLDVTIRQRLCEAQLAAGRIEGGGESVVEMVHTLGERVYMSESIVQWISDFTYRCLSASKGDVDSPASVQLLKEWSRSTIACNPWRSALTAASNFMIPKFTMYRTICEELETTCIADACECFRQMVADGSTNQTSVHDEEKTWRLDFKRRCLDKLESLGDTSMSMEKYDDAVLHYSTLLSLDPSDSQRKGVLIKRSKAHLVMGAVSVALDDANNVIMIDPSFPWGHERKHAALHAARDYENAINAFEVMLSKISQSSDPEISEHLERYVSPEKTKETIRAAIRDAIRESPPVLIDTSSGRLCHKFDQAAAFEALPVFAELISSVTTQIDHSRIQQEVMQYYRYTTFSHRWEGDEPLFAKVTRIAVYDLAESSTHNKLQMFCKIVRDAGFNWAWSDTCCINKADHHVLQEALVLMFKWYEGSALTIVFLRGVRCPSRRGDLAKSVWNSRAWTLQEYHASKVVRFYNEDWTPYLDPDVPNHKESPEIISEMEEATGISAQALMELRPGREGIRDKLCLASGRKTTRVEDAAYSMFGIFDLSLPVVYGEGDRALGRLLALLLTNSGDSSILGWTGRPNSCNSCLPADIQVFNQPHIPHIPLAIDDTEMNARISRLRASLNPLPNATINLIVTLYDKLGELRAAHFNEQRLRLPCITFTLGPVSPTPSTSGYIFRAKTNALGIVQIKTTEDLSRLPGPLVLAHPWLDFLLDRYPVMGIMPESAPELEESMNSNHPISMDLTQDSPESSATSEDRQPTAQRFALRFGRPFGQRPPRAREDKVSVVSPQSITLAARQTQALGLMVRLRQPFGALLLAPTRHNAQHEYRRVATESLIEVQGVEELSPTILNRLVNNVRVLDII